MPDTASCREALMRTNNSNDTTTPKSSSKSSSSSSSSSKSAASTLNLGLSREQADSVLRLQLGQLTRLNQDKLKEELDDLEAKGADLQRLLEQDDAVYEYMVTEFQDMDQKFGHDRKTRILRDEDGQVNEVDLVTNVRSVIVVTRGGYIKRMPLKTFESQRHRHQFLVSIGAGGVVVRDNLPAGLEADIGGLAVLERGPGVEGLGVEEGIFR
ncbi:DNA gyrase subunit A [Nitzschia inconspicua]|uniref:DNA gyrase subunit A n=1 Tax=Nitzschia inconspicua TaxID=303405 RepID=A0A9K3KAQ5_9STRA|nr:DNA gyrase subunit A [Nitzschia inconspicua]KAG7362442.1 DNA gyrase subunit A [Nitzschia inconspicua]